IGRALASYQGFPNEGFYIRAAFDIETRDTTLINDVPLYSMDKLEEYIQANGADIAIIATQKDSAQAVAERVAKAGVKNFWNFAPMELKLDGDNIVENVSLSESLNVLSYRINNK
ncbi:MAG: hypothetical protein PHC95_16155, partial [Parabacteroides sp.]|nr:hypothetical protein [Parabacteroides sp.]